MQPRISKHLLEDWERYNVLKLPKLRSAYSTSTTKAFTESVVSRTKLLLRAQSRVARHDGFWERESMCYCLCVCVCVWAPDAFTSSHLQNYFYLNWFLFLFFVFISFFSVALKLFVWKFACIYVFVFFLYLRSRGSNIRYFKVLSNSIERLRAAPPSTIDKQPATSSLIKFYLPPIRPKIK